jgi:hypothetical protein
VNLVVGQDPPFILSKFYFLVLSYEKRQIQLAYSPQVEPEAMVHYIAGAYSTFTNDALPNRAFQDKPTASGFAPATTNHIPAQVKTIASLSGHSMDRQDTGEHSANNDDQ